jgi:hypothetical protein
VVQLLFLLLGCFLPLLLLCCSSLTLSSGRLLCSQELCSQTLCLSCSRLLLLLPLL